MEETFKIRAYGYSELAQLYFPNIAPKSASMRLSRWIKQNENLRQVLESTGFSQGQRILTPKQVYLITEEFGFPYAF